MLFIEDKLRTKYFCLSSGGKEIASHLISDWDLFNFVL
jgi:hypothetical protein